MLHHSIYLAYLWLSDTSYKDSICVVSPKVAKARKLGGHTRSMESQPKNARVNASLERERRFFQEVRKTEINSETVRPVRRQFKLRTGPNVIKNFTAVIYECS
jgi:hypothetical protein